MTEKFYITTPLYYVNASPHIGHSYTNVACDCFARYKRLKGCEVLLLTGTDEHGQKVQKAAEQSGQSPIEFADSIVPRFISLWKMLDISYDDFIRTTEKRHTDTVGEVLKILHQKGDLYQGEYKGWYCIPCETFWTKSQLTQPVCPDCKRPLEEISEANYFFKISKYQDWLRKHMDANPDFIRPSSRFNEIYSLLKEPLPDLCISRPKSRLSWGIPIPFAPDHVTYVWFDALINYISAVGFYANKEKFKKFWPADLQVIGKDILRHHAVFWPIMLKSLDLEPPKTIFAHGWWILAGEKISKSKGTAIDPVDIIQRYGCSAYRYFLLREVTFGLDGVYSEDAFITRYNSDLANDLGNLLNRTLTMVEKYFNAEVPRPEAPQGLDIPLIEKAKILGKELDLYMERYDPSGALACIWELINMANKYIEESAPWTLAKEKKHQRLASMMYNLIEVLRIVTIFILPFMPKAAAEMWQQLGFQEKLEDQTIDKAAWGQAVWGTKVKKGAPLFQRILTS